ncbi:type II toxin-antitoxin system RelE/ParE family toxin [Brevibacterium salitolerans]|uniref:Type II toxin-antitoxin system RelE/ParE family toxin n=1 Tax=Brevibacterium salitolerans TaxID=1403566 RepID=A0ABN2X3E7_9MICO
MIISFRHSGLEALYRTGSRRGVRPDHAAKLTRILTILDVAASPPDLDLPGFRLHQLRGDMSGHWSMKVNGDWRVTFRFIGEDVELVDYTDYH